MVYWDTSALACMIANEPKAAQIADWVAVAVRAGDTRLSSWITSSWGDAELASALAIIERRAHGSQAGAAQLNWLKWAAAKAANAWHIRPVIEADFVIAANLCLAPSAAPLRAGDALHLAIASRTGASHFLTLDTNQARTAVGLGMGLIAL